MFALSPFLYYFNVFLVTFVSANKLSDPLGKLFFKNGVTGILRVSYGAS